MTATKPLGTYGNAVGTVTPADHKAAQSGLIAKTSGNAVRAGLFWGGTANIITAKPNMSYDVAQFTAALSRGATSGTVLLANDGTLNVATTAAPGSNSRIDIIYVWAREYSLDGVDSNPVIGVAQGTAAAVPTAPSLAAFPGAFEIGRATVGAGITATTSATITQTATFTATAGGIIPFRNTTERDLGTYQEGQLGWLIDSDAFQTYNGTSWVTVGGTNVTGLTATATGGGSSASVGTDGVITFAACTAIAVDGLGSEFGYEIIYDVTATSAAVTPYMKLRASSADISTGNYDSQNVYGIGTGTPAASFPTAQTTGWQFNVAGSILNGFQRLYGLGATRAKIGQGMHYSTQNPQTGPAAFTTGNQFRLTTTITGFSLIFTGGGNATGTIRVKKVS